MCAFLLLLTTCNIFMKCNTFDFVLKSFPWQTDHCIRIKCSFLVPLPYNTALYCVQSGPIFSSPMSLSVLLFWTESVASVRDSFVFRASKHDSPSPTVMLAALWGCTQTQQFFEVNANPVHNDNANMLILSFYYIHHVRRRSLAC